MSVKHWGAHKSSIQGRFPGRNGDGLINGVRAVGLDRAGVEGA